MTGIIKTVATLPNHNFAIVPSSALVDVHSLTWRLANVELLVLGASVSLQHLDNRLHEVGIIPDPYLAISVSSHCGEFDYDKSPLSLAQGKKGFLLLPML